MLLVLDMGNTNITLGSTNGAEATLLLPESVTQGYSGIVASYPASTGTSSDSDCQSIRFTFPSTYTYNEVYKEGTLYQKVNVPMVGHIEDDNQEGSSSDMTMYNVCGMLRVNVTTDFDAFTVTSIIVLNEAGQSLNGSNNITFGGDGKPIVNPKDGGSTSARTVTLNCGGKTVFGASAAGHSEADRMVSFYIPMMPVVNAKLKISIVGYSNSNDGSAPQKVTLVKTQTENNTTIGRNKIKTAAITVSGSEVASEDIDQSIFSVSATNKVKILPGNVRYNSETNTWFVAPNAYDFVLNGTELGGGSIRIHQADVQSRMFDVLGISREDAEYKFGFIINAFKYGAPPHGGLAFGFDRLCALFGGQETIRDFIAFPKNNQGRDVMIDSPSRIDDEQLEELNIAIKTE